MASTITNYSHNIDIHYPIAGLDNNSQGFRTNFANIQSALEISSTEISDLQLALNNPGDIVLNNYTSGELTDKGTENIDDGTLIFLTDDQPAYWRGGAWRTFVNDTSYFVPVGMIMIWSQGEETIPTGWVLCNGDNGTPDLRDRFVIGAGGAYSTGTTGGSANAVVVSHSHSETHSLTVTDPGHSHTYRGSNPSGAGSPAATDTSPGEAANTVNLTSTAAETGISVGMSLTINSSGESGTNKNLPPYFALCYVMRIQ
jgi:microcystin-dependent protein